MSEQYKIQLGELKTSGVSRGLGRFSVGFTVEPPIHFTSPQGAAELSAQILEKINVLGVLFLSSFPNDNERALVSMTHTNPDSSATIGNISGYTEYQLDEETLEKALQLSINGEHKPTG